MVAIRNVGIGLTGSLMAVAVSQAKATGESILTERQQWDVAPAYLAEAHCLVRRRILVGQKTIDSDIHHCRVVGSGARDCHLTTGTGATDIVWPSSPRTRVHPPSCTNQWWRWQRSARLSRSVAPPCAQCLM
jgi:hypothetical protein